LKVGVNDLATTHPQLVTEWHPSKNGALTPQDVTDGSGRSLWWVCTRGHEWTSRCDHRANGSGCPFCSNKAVLPGFNDLATTHPDLAAEWHPTKNGVLKPTEVTSGSDWQAWWLCSVGHEWKSRCANRLIGQGCPTCAKTGFDPAKPGILYFLINDSLRARKIGITNTGTTRLNDFRREGWTVVFTAEPSQGVLVAEVERSLFTWLRGEHALPSYLGRGEM
jgi:hypothetical protein